MYGNTQQWLLRFNFTNLAAGGSHNTTTQLFNYQISCLLLFLTLPAASLHQHLACHPSSRPNQNHEQTVGASAFPRGVRTSLLLFFLFFCLSKRCRSLHTPFHDITRGRGFAVWSGAQPRLYANFRHMVKRPTPTKPHTRTTNFFLSGGHKIWGDYLQNTVICTLNFRAPWGRVISAAHNNTHTPPCNLFSAGGSVLMHPPPSLKESALLTTLSASAPHMARLKFLPLTVSPLIQLFIPITLLPIHFVTLHIFLLTCLRMLLAVQFLYILVCGCVATCLRTQTHSFTQLIAVLPS